MSPNLTLQTESVSGGVTAAVRYRPELVVRVSGNKPAWLSIGEAEAAVMLVSDAVAEAADKRWPGVASYNGHSTVYTFWDETGRLHLWCSDDIAFRDDEQATAFVQAVSDQLNTIGGAR